MTTQIQWWQEPVVYQIYPRSFNDSNGDGIGDLPGITEKIPYLADLGIEVLWLSPIYASPNDDNGYDISDYRAIMTEFGTMEDFDELLETAHKHGIKLMMDLVVNHTSDEHEWFKQARSSKDNPYRDYYIWRDPKGFDEDGKPIPPNNWISCFSPSVWEWDEATGQFYLHYFSVKQPDLNWENPEVRTAVYDMMGRWLDRGVDGFRMDVINLISKTYPITDAPQGEGDLYGNAFAAVANGPRIHEFLHEMNQQVLAPRPGHVLTVGEMPEAALYTDPARGELDMVFQFEHVSLTDGPGGKFDPQPLELVTLKQNLAHWQAALAPDTTPTGAVSAEKGWNSAYWDNHDQPRAVSRFGDDDPAWRVRSAKTLATILHTHRGTPYIYQGEELGMANTVFRSIDDYRDLESVNHFHERVRAGDDPAAVLAGIAPVSRDNARTPVHWDSSEKAGFTTGEPWIALAPDHGTVNAAAQVGVPGSVFEHYRQLISLRHDDDALALGTFGLLAADHPTAWVILRQWRAPETQGGGIEQLLLIAQCAREDLPLTGQGGLLTALAAEGLQLEEWSGAEQMLRAADPDVQPGSTHAGLPEALPGWDSVLLRRRA